MSMLKDNVSQIKAIVAVSNDHKIMPPCGRCRELMFEIDRRNLQTDVILENGKVVKLADIFPERWQELWEDSIKPVA
jgi:cytidine deaminase